MACPEARRQATSRRFDPLATSLGNDRYFSIVAVHSVVFARQHGPRRPRRGSDSRGQAQPDANSKNAAGFRRQERRAVCVGLCMTTKFLAAAPRGSKTNSAYRSRLATGSDGARRSVSCCLSRGPCIPANKRSLSGRKELLAALVPDAMKGAPWPISANLELLLPGRAHCCHLSNSN